MIRRPPRSTLFPYTSSSDLHEATALPDEPALTPEALEELDDLLDERSEEHTSELQSQSNLVCRLLLEKKKRGEVGLCAFPDERHVHRIGQSVQPRTAGQVQP